MLMDSRTFFDIYNKNEYYFQAQKKEEKNPHNSIT